MTKISVSLVSPIEKHGLSFIETSALDSTNVELAFRNILEGLLSTLSYIDIVQVFPSDHFATWKL